MTECSSAYRHGLPTESRMVVVTPHLYLHLFARKDGLEGLFASRRPYSFCHLPPYYIRAHHRCRRRTTRK